ncbi:serine/threonine/tyrosine-interacting protein-like [Cylas formicarius]|uniref:serine/threonine/tyrosine-interacting protein-like n=1 Tax=Cylas formicarius TaxID=197179 RepID=UPI0029583C26|nr:serine/threonine/tyrosine-interacting protein-like [Cylas formicarius]
MIIDLLGGCPTRQNIPYYSPQVDRDFFFNASMQEIVPGVYLGNYFSAQMHCLGNLFENGVRYIICVRQDVEAHFIKPQVSDPTFTYMTLEIADSHTENIIRFFPKVKEFIDEALSKNFKVLVHGNQGNSRSATLVMAYIMEKYHLSTLEALQFVKQKRASVNPNEGFRAQLIEYEPIYKARQSLSAGEPSLSNVIRQKRKSEHLGEPVECDLVPPPPPSPEILDANYEMYHRPNFMEFSMVCGRDCRAKRQVQVFS